MNKGAISKYVDDLPANGRYTFSRAELEEKFQASDAAIKLALLRLRKRSRVISPRRGFYVVVPEQYRFTGAPPPAWFIDALMKDWDSQYYVGLLSAAEVYGAAHQRPQEFQVICDRPHRSIEISRYRIHFFKKKNVENVAVLKHKTPTGFMRVSSPETTALDLIRYYQDAGFYSNVGAVISELSAKMQAKHLLAAAKCDVELVVVQRLGYLLDLSGKARLADPLNDWLATKSPRIASLRPDMDSDLSQLNRRWMLLVNENVELEP